MEIVFWELGIFLYFQLYHLNPLLSPNEDDIVVFLSLKAISFVNC